MTATGFHPGFSTVFHQHIYKQTVCQEKDGQRDIPNHGEQAIKLKAKGADVFRKVSKKV
jgi:hypothetical protein